MAFLHAGKAIHTIFPSSKCWCVDGETKFVLRIRENNYYRIELPNTSIEDLQTAEELKRVFSQISQYELTACPFKRGFTVELPETPKTPVQKRPWKPRNNSTSLSIGVSSTSSKGGQSTSDKSSSSSIDEGHIVPSIENAFRSRFTVSISNQSILQTANTPTRPRALSGTRAVTAPPQLIRRAAASPDTIVDTTKRHTDKAETLSLSSSVDSFHSFTSLHSSSSSLPPSPPYSDPPSPPQKPKHDLGIDVPKARQHRRDISELTIVAEPLPQLDSARTRTWQEEGPLTLMRPETPALTNDAASQDDDFWPDVKTPSPSSALCHHRSNPSRRRAHSPLPSSANLYSPRSRMTDRHSPSSVLIRTCSLLLGPPVQLVALMLNIAAKIRNGTLRRSFSSDRERPMPCTWNYSDSEDDGGDMWEEDDYGISLGTIPSSKTKAVIGEVGKSWEID